MKMVQLLSTCVFSRQWFMLLGMWAQRSQVYNQLSLFFPEHMTQPSESLTDLLNI